MGDASQEVTLFSPVARTATLSSASKGCGYARGCVIVVRVTTIGGAAPSVTAAVQCLDATSGQWVTQLTSAAMTAVGTYVLRVYPGSVPVNNLVADDLLWETFRVMMTHANSDSITYSVSAHLMQ